MASISGGVVNVNGSILVAEGGNGVLDMSGGAMTTTTATNGVTFNADAVYLYSGLTGVLNLRGGTLAAGFVNCNQGGLSSTFNFNGGALKATQSIATFMQGLTGAYVYGGGATIDDGGNTIAIAQPLLAPTGSGVAATGLTVSGSGYVAPPIVNITGGGGSGATAAATIDANGNLTGIAITNPGVDYTSAPASPWSAAAARAASPARRGSWPTPAAA